jgi:hypothetical protein
LGSLSLATQTWEFTHCYFVHRPEIEVPARHASQRIEPCRRNRGPPMNPSTRFPSRAASPVPLLRFRIGTAGTTPVGRAESPFANNQAAPPSLPMAFPDLFPGHTLPDSRDAGSFSPLPLHPLFSLRSPGQTLLRCTPRSVSRGKGFGILRAHSQALWCSPLKPPESTKQASKKCPPWIRTTLLPSHHYHHHHHQQAPFPVPRPAQPTSR